MEGTEKKTNSEVECGLARSFGLIAVKPRGMTGDVAEIIDYVLDPEKNSDSEGVMEELTRGMSVEERGFFLGNLGRVKVVLHSYGDFSGDPSFWMSSYEREAGDKYWYEDLMEEVNRGAMEAYVVESDMSQEDLDLWLTLFKGRENVVITKGDKVEVIRPGKGVRGLLDSEAVMIDQDRLLAVADESNGDVIASLLRGAVGKDILYIDLPEGVARVVWGRLSQSEKVRILGNPVHMTGEIGEVRAGVERLVGADGGVDDRASVAEILDRYREVKDESGNV